MITSRRLQARSSSAATTCQVRILPIVRALCAADANYIGVGIGQDSYSKKYYAY